MSAKKGILTLISIVLTLLIVRVAPMAWSQDEPRDADVLLGALKIETGDWVADVGSGEGEYTLQMAEAVGDSGRAFAVDIDEDDLEDLNEIIKERDVTNVTTVSSVYDNPMLPRRSFDAVLIRNAYHEFTAHEQMLRHLRAALKPGGRLVMEESIEDDLVDANRARQVEAHDLSMHHARRELMQAGFEVVREVDTLRDEGDHRHWMMVAARPEENRDS
ncbi:MAG: class I SAM-dependent methyltransferase [Salinibacter sp.]|uniref:class I SAM-dependent methyltransferase n=1 Tax=Salinibacter sp. TaxID=2065818 RepID=UPI0035D4CED9